MEHDGGYGFMSGLFLGATLGAVTALLLAPKSGRELRSDLQLGGERLRERASIKANDLVGRGEAVLGRARDAARDAAEGVKRGASRLARKGEEAIEDGPISSSSIST